MGVHCSRKRWTCVGCNFPREMSQIAPNTGKLWKFLLILAMHYELSSSLSNSEMYGYDSNDIDTPESPIDFSFVKIVERHGYNVEQHEVYSDGYKLMLHRISGSKSNWKPAQRVVYVQHGFLMWTVNLVLRGPKDDLVFSLVDAGCDVWMGNVRGNAFSRSHKTLKPDDPQFWNFSYHEIGLGDVKAFIDYTLKATGRQTLTLVGYSAGATEGLILLSSMPEYNSKVNLFINIAPVAFWKHAGYRIQSLGTLIGTYEYAVDFVDIKHGEMFSRSGIGRTLDNVCGHESGIFDQLCSLLFKIMSPMESTGSFHNGTATLFMRTWPAGTSARFFYHLGQNIRSGDFAAYDFGQQENLRIYNSPLPPLYQLDRISTPVAVFFGGSDIFTDPQDVEILNSSLPNVIKMVKIDNFNHLDFVLADNLSTLLYEPVNELIQTYSHTGSQEMEENPSFIPEVVFVE